MAKTTKARTPEYNPNISGFLGIGEGKVATAKAAGEVAIEKAKQDTLALQARLSAGGYDPAAEALAAEAAGSKTTLYLVIGTVLILMVGLFFIIKYRRK